MLKRKYGDRSEWKRVVKREYVQSFLDTKYFKGYISLLKVKKVTHPLFIQYDEKKVCIVNDGYSWLQHFPIEERYSLTTMFDSDGKIVQWYIDICYKNGLENGVPWMDDLFLDIIILPTGEVILQDADELEAALNDGNIDISLYEMAWHEANKIKKLIDREEFHLIKLSSEHKDKLTKNIM
ncbi:DUF402 domain-containing protein [Bacillus sp. FSL K6-3431]|uniref:DUF402 domain-containing protein n=1 Tax=Bacillus sp. FSL K6-3431 TaxID=2921500 RepID=UPI0030F51271